MASSSKEQVANTAAENSSTKKLKPIHVLSQEEIADGFGMKRLGDYYEETSEREIVDLVLKSSSSGPNAAMFLAAREFNQSRRRTYQRCVKEVDFGSPVFCLNCEVAKKRRKELLNEAESSKSPGAGLTKPVTTRVYEALRHDDAIRVLELQPANARDAPLHARLVEIDRNDAAYNALSYTWGGIDETGELFLEHGKLEITGNLDLALRALRQEEAVLTIWVDAVCINQEDLGEKANQVARMDEIYKTADSVMAWLGPASETSLAALDFMDILAELSRSPEYDEDIRPHPVILEPTNFDIDPDVASEITATRVETNVDEVLERLWFSRMWVVQEVLLAKDLVLQIGDHRIPWEQFRRAIKMLWAAEQYVPRFCDEVYDGGSIYHPLGLVYARDQLQANDGGSTIFQDYTMQIYARAKDFKRWGCKDDRDRVFAILGFIPQDSSLCITPDYMSSPTEVFVDFARQHILHEGLTVLLFAGLEQRQGPAFMDIVQNLAMKYAEMGLEHVPDDLFSAPELLDHDLLPSWTPDLRPNLIKPIHRFWRPMNFHAAMNRPPAVILDKRCAHMIAVRGNIFDTITQTIPTPTSSSEKPLTHKETLFHIARIWYATKAFYAAQGNQYPVLSRFTQNLDAIFDNLITASHTNSSLVSLMSSNPPDFVPKILAFLKDVSDRGTPALHEHYASPNPSPTAAETASFVMTVSRLLSADQVIFTENGFAGLAPNGAREGDRVSWVNGLQSFLVVRKMLGGGGLLEVVGPGFLVGAMEGEIFAEEGEWEGRWGGEEMIHLV